MNDTVESIIPQLRTNMATLSPAVYVYLHTTPDYIPTTTNPVVPPYAYIYSGDELEGTPYHGRAQDIVTLHLFARSKPELQRMQDKCAYLDEYRAPSFGNAYAPYYQIQSKPSFEEADGIWHASLTFTVDYTDKRKVS